MTKIIPVVFFLMTAMFASQVKAQSKVPFVYLNQYFSFELINENEIKIANRIIDFSTFQVSQDSENIRIQIDNFKSLLINKSTTISFKDSANQDFGSALLVSFKKKDYLVPKIKEITTVCLNQASLYTKIQLCKKLAEAVIPDSGFETKVEIDNQPFANFGTVVLKEKAEPVVFSAELSPVNSIQIQSVKRNILPVAIIKKAEQDFFLVQFRDMNIEKKSVWTAKINLDQTAFSILFDPLLTLTQDIFFSSKVQASSLNYVRTELKKEQSVYIQEYGPTVEPFVIYLGLSGSLPNQNIKLNSDLGKGLKAVYKFKFNKNYDGVLEAYVFSTSIVSDSSNLVFNNSQFLYSAAGGVSFQIYDYIKMVSQIRLRKDLFFKKHDVTTLAVDVYPALDASLALTPQWIFFNSKFAQASVNLGANYVFGTNAEGENINSGLAYQIGLGFTRAFNFGQFQVNTYYSRRSQNTATASISEQAAYYGLGYHLAF